MEDLSDIKNISIIDYLSERGFTFVKTGKYMYCKSPFSQERTPSFCVYPTNTFYDWSNSLGGDIINLVQEMEGLDFYKSIEFLKDGTYDKIDFTDIEPEKEDCFELNKFIEHDVKNIHLINRYAFRRGISRNFEPSRFFVKNKSTGALEKKLSMGFIHVDEELSVCGIKMRSIEGRSNLRFSARGKQKFYILRNTKRDLDKSTILYISESESSANSLFEFLEYLDVNSVVVSFGSWSNIPDRLPDFMEKIEKRTVIIDYDGNEDLYNEKIIKFKHFKANDVKLKLPKGEDINSLYVKGLIFKYKNFLVND